MSTARVSALADLGYGHVAVPSAHLPARETREDTVIPVWPKV